MTAAAEQRIPSDAESSTSDASPRYATTARPEAECDPDLAVSVDMDTMSGGDTEFTVEPESDSLYDSLHYQPLEKLNAESIESIATSVEDKRPQEEPIYASLQKKKKKVNSASANLVSVAEAVGTVGDFEIQVDCDDRSTESNREPVDRIFQWQIERDFNDERRKVDELNTTADSDLVHTNLIELTKEEVIVHMPDLIPTTINPQEPSQELLATN